ncbi:MAG: hypothetical protein ACRENQ_14520, partial [Gemmatimonadaceae bacterium]
HHFDVFAQRVDLRTVEFLYPTFPRLQGWLAGSTVLDSSWMDVQFSNADLSLADTDALVTRLTGSGRITYGEPYMTYDASLVADSLSLTALRRSYPALPMIGDYSGTIQVQGTTPDLFLDVSLRGPGGAISYNGHVDADAPSFGARGSGRIVGLDPAVVVPGARSPAGSLTGNYEVDVSGDSLADLVGSASVSLERSEFDSVHVFSSRARLRFADGRVHLDTLRLETSAAMLTANGALGLHAGVVDSLSYAITVDSLGGLRPFLASRTAVQTGIADSLAGRAELHGAMTGNLDSLSVRGELAGSGLYINKDRGASTSGRFALDDVLRAPHGTVSFELDTLVLAGVRVDTIGFEARLAQVKASSATGPQFAGTFNVGALNDNGPTLAVGGTISHLSGWTEVTVQSGNADLGADRWTLAHAGTLRIDSTRITIDTLRMTNGKGGVWAVAGSVPDEDSVHVWMRADSIPVRDVALLLQVADTMSGWGSLHADITGTRAAPRATVDAAGRNLQYGNMQLDRVVAGAKYVNRRTDATLEIYRNGVQSLLASASLPMDVQLFSARLLDDSLSGSIRADSTDFAIIEAFVPTVSNARGRLFVSLDVGGTWKHPTLNGFVHMNDAQMAINDLGISLRGLNAELTVSAANDSLAIRRLEAISGPSSSDRLSVGGFVDYS